MATLTVTFPFASTAEGFSWTTTAGVPNLSVYTAGVGNPQGSLGFGRINTNNNLGGYWSLATTWEGLGITAGETVTNIRINGGYTKCTQMTGTYLRFGPYELKDGAGANPSTLLTYRDAAAPDGSWVSLGVGSDIAVPSAIQASNSSIQLWMSASSVNGFFTGATGYFDEISYVITYGAVAARQAREPAVNFQFPAIL